jgi:predicted nucleic-acid-binding protein
LRYLLNDDKAQSKKAAALIRGTSFVLITDVVISETIWTLTGKKYKLGKDGVIRVLNSLFEEPNIFFEEGQVVWKALGDFRRAEAVKVGGKKKEADFSDALIVNKAKFQSLKAQVGFQGVYTFDVAAQQIAGTRKP